MIEISNIIKSDNRRWEMHWEHSCYPKTKSMTKLNITTKNEIIKSLKDKNKEKIDIENKEYVNGLLGSSWEKLDDTETIKKYVEAFLSIIPDMNTINHKNKNHANSIINKLKEWKTLDEVTEKDVDVILRLMHQADQRKESIGKNKLLTLSKRSFDPKIIMKNKTYNCWWSSLMFWSIIKQLWWKIYYTQIYHHILTIMESKWKTYRIDPLMNEKIKKLYDTSMVNITENVSYKVNWHGKFSLIQLKEPVIGQKTHILYNSFEDAYKINNGNYGFLLKCYEEINKNKNRGIDMKDMKINWPSPWEIIYPEAVINLINDLWGVEKIKKNIDWAKNKTINSIEKSKLRKDEKKGYEEISKTTPEEFIKNLKIKLNS